MRRARLLLLLFLLPARAASLWALPHCDPALVCHMGPDGGSCCPAGECSVKECSGSDAGVVVPLAPALTPIPPVRLAGLEAAEKIPVQAVSAGSALSRDVPHPPPRA